MKILLTVDPELPVPPVGYGGIERVVENLIDVYMKEGHEVTLCAHRDSVVSCRLVYWKGTQSQKGIDIFKNIIVLTSLVYKESFDVIHSFSRLAYMIGILHLRIPIIMSYQRIPSVNTIRKAAFLSVNRNIIFTGCSEHITNILSKASAKVYTIHNCVPIEKYDFVNELEYDAPLIFLGRIEDIKGAHIAIEVAQKSGKRLIIAGNIPIGKEAYFESMIKPHLNSRIQYVGVVNDELKNKFLGEAIALLMPIQWDEPFGIVMVEAMACGTPVLGFVRGSIPEIIQNGINGFICENTAEMINRVNDLKVIDRQKVRAIAETKFSKKIIADQYIKLYKQQKYKQKASNVSE